MSVTKAAKSERARTPLTGSVRLPGDKSISHRALMLGALASGETRIEGLLEGDDVLATAAAMRALGAQIDRLADDGIYRVRGVGTAGFRTPQNALDFGNAGTGARLVMGLVAGSQIDAQFIGDASLSARPMARVMRVLQKMGAQINATDGDYLPLHIQAAPLIPADITPDVTSAQVKSAILLAAVNTPGTTLVREKILTRDHSENMLELFGAALERYEEDAHHIVALHGPARLTGCDLSVPGDPSSAAFPMIAALLVPGSDVVLENIMLNRQRDGLIRVLRDMGADIDFMNRRHAAGEQVADLRVRHSHLRGIEVPAAIAPDMIDEYPALAVAATAAQGVTHMAGLEELRVKESDRLAAIVDGLRANGANVESGTDWLRVTGGPVPGGGTVATHHDHRIAMSFLCLGLIADTAIEIDDTAMIATSFPNFFDLMARLNVEFDHGA